MTEPFPPPSEPQQPYAPPQYGAPQYPNPQAPAYSQPYGAPYSGPAVQKNGMGVASLVLGILAILTGWFFVGGVFGVLAIVFGAIGRGRAKRGEANNGGMAIAGLVCGVVGILVAIAVGIAVAFVINSDSGQRYRDCLDQAYTQEEIQACADQFRDDLTD